jgi:hypothetical protein
MKKVFLLIGIVFLMMMSSALGAVDNAELQATLLRYEPLPATPGDYVTVYVKMQNNGTGIANNLNLIIKPEYPFSLHPAETGEEYIGYLPAYKPYVAEFKLKVDEGAVEGANSFKVRYNVDNGQNTWVEQEFEISVRTQDAIISVESVMTEPTEIVPGSNAKVKINLKNLADSELTDITINLDLKSSTLPFAPVGSTSEKTIYRLESGKEHEFVFDIIATPAGTAGVYKVPINLTYYDNVGNMYSKSYITALIVNSVPEISLVVDGTDLYEEKMIGSITLKLVNKGLNDIKFLNIKLVDTDDFDIISSSNEEYLGNLDSDDFETAEFDLLLMKNEGSIDLPVEIEYKDSNNKPYSLSKTVRLTIHTADQLGIQKSSKAGLIVFLVIIIGGGYWFLRRRKKKKQQAS